MLPLLVIAKDTVPVIRCHCGEPAVFIQVVALDFDNRPVTKPECAEHLSIQDEPRLVLQNGTDLGIIASRGQG